MQRINRRRFMELAVAGTAGAVLAACSGQPIQPAKTPVPTPSRAPGKQVSNENRPDRNVRYYTPFVPPTPEAWRLGVGGLVTAPLTLSLADIQQLPALEQVSRMKCVESWSFKAQWGGFSLASLLEQVKLKPEAQHVYMWCGDGYLEVLPLEDLLQERVLFAYRMDGDLLAPEYGSPLRLIVPWKYGYKGAKCITSLEFASKPGQGYWSSVGPYTVHGDIQPGYDHPQDLGGRVQITEAGKELTY